MQIKAKKVGATLLSALITVFIYILLHDSIFTAHVRGIGGNYTNTSSNRRTDIRESNAQN